MIGFTSPTAASSHCFEQQKTSSLDQLLVTSDAKSVQCSAFHSNSISATWDCACLACGGYGWERYDITMNAMTTMWLYANTLVVVACRSRHWRRPSSSSSTLIKVYNLFCVIRSLTTHRWNQIQAISYTWWAVFDGVWLNRNRNTNRNRIWQHKCIEKMICWL